MNMVYRILIECRKKVKRIKLIYKKILNLLLIEISEVEILIKGIKLCLATNLISLTQSRELFFFYHEDKMDHSRGTDFATCDK